MSREGTSNGDVQEWIIQRVVEYDTGGGETVTGQTPLADLGFSSVYALTLCGDIEDQYGLEIEPTLLWDQETVGDLARALSTLLEKSR